MKLFITLPDIILIELIGRNNLPKFLQILKRLIRRQKQFIAKLTDDINDHMTDEVKLQ